MILGKNEELSFYPKDFWLCLLVFLRLCGDELLFLGLIVLSSYVIFT